MSYSGKEKKWNIGSLGVGIYKAQSYKQFGDLMKLFTQIHVWLFAFENRIIRNCTWRHTHDLPEEACAYIYQSLSYLPSRTSDTHELLNNLVMFSYVLLFVTWRNVNYK